MFHPMNGINKKYKAFTIIELMVVSTLAVITASAAFSAIGIFDKLFSTYQSEVDQELDLQAFQSVFQNDLSNCKRAEVDDNWLIFTNASNAIGYEITSDKITRVLLEPKQILDSLNYSNISFTTFFKNQLVVENIVDQINIQFLDESTQREIIVSKEYDSKEKLNYNDYY